MTSNVTDDINETSSSTPNFRTELAEKLAELVPEVVADGRIDVAKIRELLDGDAEDESERFGLFWPGKMRAIRAAQEPTTATLEPVPEESKDWDSTKNVYIEGDNLEVLKVLQKHYHGRIKMIYIDPPYNTGKDFIYPDDFHHEVKSYLQWTNQVDAKGTLLKSNVEKNGRFHSNWLNSIYPRLKLAKGLLSKNGIIAISISDIEFAQLRILCNEIYGENNFIGVIVWESTTQPDNIGTARFKFQTKQEYILLYAADLNSINRFNLKTVDNQRSYPFEGEYGKCRYEIIERAYSGAYARPTLRYPILGHYPREGKQWQIGKQEAERLLSKHRLEFTGGTIKRVVYPQDEEKTVSYKPFWSIFSADFAGTSQKGKAELNQLLGFNVGFDTVKPVQLLLKICEYVSSSSSQDYFLDFYSGSATMAHAVMQLNAEDDGNRRYIMVQLPEPVDPDSAAGKAGFRTIADIGRKRIDLAGEKIRKDYAERLAKRETPLDIGYRTYRLTDTNFAKWRESSDVEPKALEQDLLELQDNANDDASELALLTEVLLKQGYSLTEKVETIDVDGLTVWSVVGGLVLAYMNEKTKPTLEQLRALVERNPAPERLIVLEDAFQGDDELKTNLVQAAKTKHVELWTA